MVFFLGYTINIVGMRGIGNRLSSRRCAVPAWRNAWTVAVAAWPDDHWCLLPLNAGSPKAVVSTMR